MCFLFSFSVVTPALTQPLIVEAWVRRVPLVEGAEEHCVRQKLFMVFEQNKFGLISRTDTLALTCAPFQTKTPLWTDVFTDDTYTILQAKDEAGHIILVITPLTRLKATHGLIISSSQQICNHDR